MMNRFCKALRVGLIPVILLMALGLPSLNAQPQPSRHHPGQVRQQPSSKPDPDERPLPPMNRRSQVSGPEAGPLPLA